MRDTRYHWSLDTRHSTLDTDPSMSPNASQENDTFATTRLQTVVNWARRSSIWPLPFATACCGIELMATASSRYDLARFGAEAMRFSPRQSDLMLVAGRVERSRKIVYPKIAKNVINSPLKLPFLAAFFTLARSVQKRPRKSTISMHN